MTLQLADDITVYVGMPIKEVVASAYDLDRTARRQAARMLRLAADELETVEGLVEPRCRSPLT